MKEKKYIRLWGARFEQAPNEANQFIENILENLTERERKIQFHSILFKYNNIMCEYDLDTNQSVVWLESFIEQAKESKNFRALLESKTNAYILKTEDHEGAPWVYKVFEAK